MRDDGEDGIEPPGRPDKGVVGVVGVNGRPAVPLNCGADTDRILALAAPRRDSIIRAGARLSKAATKGESKARFRVSSVYK